jgi:hypothetical protein
VHSGAWTRPSWFATGQDVASFTVKVQRGSRYADTEWICRTNSTAVVGTDNLTWSQSGRAVVNDLNNEALVGLKSLSYTGEVASTGATPAVDWTTGDLQKTTLTASATPTYTPPPGSGTVLHHVVQGGSGGYTLVPPSPLIGATPPQPSPGVGDHTYYTYLWDGTSYHYAGGAVTLSGTTLSLVGSAIKLRDAAASGQQWVSLGGAWYLIGPETGTALGDASVTLQFGTANQYYWPAATNTTAIRTLTLGTTGLAAGPNAGVGAELQIMFLRAAGYAHNIVVANGGGGGGTLFTLPSGTTKALIATFYFDGTDWKLAGFRYLGTVTAA